MAKVISKFKLRGTIGGITFYKSCDQELAREKGTPGVTKEQFAKNSAFDPIRKHSKEFGSCAKKSRIFRQLAKPLYDKAKDVSFVGRANQLLFEILEEDVHHSRGERSLSNGLSTKDGVALLLDFEGNKLRPLDKVLTVPIAFDWSTTAIKLLQINVMRDIVWPEPEANQVHLQLGIANWNCDLDTFEHCFSDAIVLNHKDELVSLSFSVAPLSNQNLWLAFFHVGFSNKQRKKVKLLPRKWNTTTIIGVKDFIDE